MATAEFEAFLDACKAGDQAAVEALLTRDPALVAGRAPSGETPIVAALYRGHLGIVDVLLDAGAPLDLFAAAALGRRADVEARLAESPTCINELSYDGWTPLHLAAFFGRVDVATLLLARGAHVNARSTNAMRNTPLHAAVAGGRVESALALIEAGRGGQRGGRRWSHAAAHRGGGRLPADCRGAAPAQGRSARRGRRGSHAAGARRGEEPRRGGRLRSP